MYIHKVVQKCFFRICMGIKIEKYIFKNNLDYFHIFQILVDNKVINNMYFLNNLFNESCVFLKSQDFRLMCRIMRQVKRLKNK